MKIRVVRRELIGFFLICNPFGYFRFNGVVRAAAHRILPSDKRSRFAPVFYSALDDSTDVVIEAEP